MKVDMVIPPFYFKYININNLRRFDGFIFIPHENTNVNTFFGFFQIFFECFAFLRFSPFSSVFLKSDFTFLFLQFYGIPIQLQYWS